MSPSWVTRRVERQPISTIRPLWTAGLDPVALAEGAIELQRQAAEQVGDGRLEREADDRRQHRRGGEQRQDVDAGQSQAHQHHQRGDRDLDDVAQDRRHVDAQRGQDEIEEDEARQADESAEKGQDRAEVEHPGGGIHGVRRRPRGCQREADGEREDEPGRSAVLPVTRREHEGQDERADQCDRRPLEHDPGRGPAAHGDPMLPGGGARKQRAPAQANAGSTRSANSRAGSRVSRPKNSMTKSVQPSARWRSMRSITCSGVPQMPCSSSPPPMWPP